MKLDEAIIKVKSGAGTKMISEDFKPGEFVYISKTGRLCFHNYIGMNGVYHGSAESGRNWRVE